MSRTNFHGPRDVKATDFQPYSNKSLLLQRLDTSKCLLSCGTLGYSVVPTNSRKHTFSNNIDCHPDLPIHCSLRFPKKRKYKVDVFTLKLLSKFAADDILKLRKQELIFDVNRLLAARQTIHMTCHALFSLKTNNKQKFKTSSAVIMMSALRG